MDGKIWIMYIANTPNAESPHELEKWVKELEKAIALPVMYKEDFER
jgi:hypothetical protein